MFLYVFSIVLIVVSNILYNICQKLTPANVNPFSALLVTYLTAVIVTTIALLFYKTDGRFFHSFNGINWTSILLGVSIIGVEFGYLMAFRAGWDISLGSLVANIFLALMLIPIGILFYKERFKLNKILGVVLCIIGLILLNIN